MDDRQIINLYFERNEQAIKETDVMYGSFCYRIAMNILNIREDAEECVNDTYYSVWNKIPPTVPESFKLFLGRITTRIGKTAGVWKSIYPFQSSTYPLL